MSAPSPARPGMPPLTVVGLLVLLLGIQPVTTDLYLPALPTLQRALGADVGGAQLTLSALIVCFGAAQLVVGPLSDRLGRRPVLLGGLALYVLASVLAALAPGIEALVAARALQGAAMAASVAGARAIVRDLYEPADGARVMARALGGLGLIALVSPLLGGLLVQWVHWRATLAVLAVFGALALAVVAWRFTETLPQRNPQATRLGPLLANWRQIGAHRTFIAWTLLLSCTYGGLFIMLAGSSYVFIEVLGLSRVAAGAVLAGNSLAYVIGTQISRRLLMRRGMRRTVALGGVASLAGGAGLAVASLAGWHEASVWVLIVPQWLYCLGHAAHVPCGQAGAVGPFREKAGTAAALSGALMMLTAFVTGLWLGRALDGTVFPLTLGVAVYGAAVAAVAWTLVQRHGEPKATAVAASQPA